MAISLYPGIASGNEESNSPWREAPSSHRDEGSKTIAKTIAATGFAAAMMAGLAVSISPTAAADPVGPGCGAYMALHTAGPDSMEGMSQDLVAKAIENEPDLTVFAAALSSQLNPQVYIVDTLNYGQYTVFAPTDAAFHKLPASMIDQLKTNPLRLDNMLNYHIVQGRLNPNEVVGTHKTLEGQTVNVTSRGSDLRVNDADFVCGGVTTLNATIYTIDTVLMPPS
jgi:uncharacterized surface protein with fasciclin (FAS1) repeats